MKARGRFEWHTAARVHEGGLFASGPVAAADLGQAGAVIADRPGLAAVQAAFAAAQAGLAFRIGGEAVPDAGAGLFETLTGGSSGTPRRIVRAQASWAASFAVNAGLFGIGPGVRVAVLGRLSHSLALYGALEGVHLGAEVQLLERLRPDRQRAALAFVQVLYATPGQLRALVAVGGAALGAMRFVIVGGEVLDAGLRKGVAAMCPNAAIRVFYGAAEASFISLADETSPEGSVGRPYPGVRIAVRLEGRVLPDGQVGEIWVQSLYLSQGYAGVPGAAMWREGWLWVGEYGWMQGGHLYLAGRAGRRVKIAGRVVYPEEIEAFLAALPGVRRAAVLARKDRVRDAVLEAAVQGAIDECGVTDAEDALDIEDLLMLLRAQFGTMVAPRRVHLVADWPLLPSGKTDLVALERVIWPRI